MLAGERTEIEISQEQIDGATYPVVTLSRTAPQKTQEVVFTLTKRCVCIVLDGGAATADIRWEDFDRLVDAVRAVRRMAQDE